MRFFEDVIVADPAARISFEGYDNDTYIVESEDDNLQVWTAGNLAIEITPSQQLVAHGLGTGGLTDYDAYFGDALTTPSYGLIRLGNSSIGVTSHNAAALDIDGAFIIRNQGTPATSNIEYLFADSSNNIRFALAKSGAGNATYSPRSLIIAGPAVLDDTIVTVGYWQTQGIFHNLAMDTGTDGADLGVQNDLEVEGDIFTDSLIESTSAAGITVGGTGGIIVESFAPSIKMVDSSPTTANYQLLVDNGDLSIKLDSAGDGTYETTMMLFHDSGNIGIGTFSPDEMLEIARSSSTVKGGAIRLSNSNPTLEDDVIVGELEFYKDDTSGGGAAVVSRIYSAGTDVSAGNFDLTFEDGVTGPHTLTDLAYGSGITLTIEFKFSILTADSDPGNGNFRFNAATMAATTYIYVDDNSDSGVDLSNIFASLNTGSLIYIQKKRDAGTAGLFRLSGAPIDGTGYWRIPVTYQSDGGTEFGINDRSAWIIYAGSTANYWTDNTTYVAPPSGYSVRTDGTAAVGFYVHPTAGTGIAAYNGGQNLSLFANGNETARVLPTQFQTMYNIEIVHTTDASVNLSTGSTATGWFRGSDEWTGNHVGLRSGNMTGSSGNVYMTTGTATVTRGQLYFGDSTASSSPLLENASATHVVSVDTSTGLLNWTAVGDVGATSYWSRSGTTVRTATAGDDVQIDSSSYIFLGGVTTTWIYGAVGGNINFTIASNSIMNITPSSVTVYKTLGVNVTDQNDIGTDTAWWKDVYAQRYYLDEIGTYIYSNSGVLTFVDGTTGSRTLAQLATVGSGTVTSVAATGTKNGLTLVASPAPIIGAGTITLGGTLAINNSDWSGTDLSVANGGTGLSTVGTNYLLTGNAAGALTAESALTFTGGILTVGTGVTINGITLEDSSDRSGLLEINRKGSTAYAGISTKFSTTAWWSLMATQTTFGMYDDTNADWILNYAENGAVTLYWNGAAKIATSTLGVTIQGRTTALVTAVVGGTTAPAAGYCFRLNGSSNKGYAADWTASSDVRLKTKIRPYGSVLGGLMTLYNSTYGLSLYNRWLLDEDNNPTNVFDTAQEIGLIAQEVMGIFPQIVPGSDEDGYSISYMRLAAIAATGVAELKTEKDREIEDLQKRIGVLEIDNKKLKKEVYGEDYN